MSDLDVALARQEAIGATIDAAEDQLRAILETQTSVREAKAKLAATAAEVWATLQPILLEGGKASLRVGAEILLAGVMSSLEKRR